MSDVEREPFILGKEFARSASDAAYNFAQLVQRVEFALRDMQALEQKISDLDEKLTNCIKVFKRVS
jgi:hypothetical protein